jgi:hypothetical protein
MHYVRCYYILFAQYVSMLVLVLFRCFSLERLAINVFISVDHLECAIDVYVHSFTGGNLILEGHP